MECPVLLLRRLNNYVNKRICEKEPENSEADDAGKRRGVKTVSQGGKEKPDSPVKRAGGGDDETERI